MFYHYQESQHSQTIIFRIWRSWQFYHYQESQHSQTVTNILVGIIGFYHYQESQHSQTIQPSHGDDRTFYHYQESQHSQTSLIALTRVSTFYHYQESQHSQTLKLHFHAAVLCKCIRLHPAARLLTVYHYSKIWHKSLSIMKRSSASIVSWQGPSKRTKLRFSSLAFS